MNHCDSTLEAMDPRRRHGVVVSVVLRMNEVMLRRARLVPGWVTVFWRVGPLFWYVTSQLGQLSFPSLFGRQIEYQLYWSKGGNVTSVR